MNQSYCRGHHGKFVKKTNSTKVFQEAWNDCAGNAEMIRNGFSRIGLSPFKRMSLREILGDKDLSPANSLNRPPPVSQDAENTSGVLESASTSMDEESSNVNTVGEMEFSTVNTTSTATCTMNEESSTENTMADFELSTVALEDEEILTGMSYLDINLTGSTDTELMHNLDNETENLMSQIAAALASSSSTIDIDSTSSVPKLSGHSGEVLANTPSRNLEPQSGNVLATDPKVDVEPGPSGTSLNPGDTLTSTPESMSVPEVGKVPTTDPERDVDSSPPGTSQDPVETLSTPESKLVPQTGKVLTSDPKGDVQEPGPSGTSQDSSEILDSAPESTLVPQTGEVDLPYNDPKRDVELSSTETSQHPGETLTSTSESTLVPQTSTVHASDPKRDVEPIPSGMSQDPCEILTSTQ